MNQPPPSYNEVVNPQFYHPGSVPHQAGPPYPNYPQQMPMDHHVVYTNVSNAPGEVITQQPTTIMIIQQPKVPKGQMRMRCPYCQSDVKTKVESKAGLFTLITSVFFCLVGLPFGCCCIGLIPYCLLQNKKHFCPACNSFVGEYSPYVTRTI